MLGYVPRGCVAACRRPLPLVPRPGPGVGGFLILGGIRHRPGTFPLTTKGGKRENSSRTDAAIPGAPVVSVAELLRALRLAVHAAIMSPSVAALFVRSDSVYKTLPGVDCWDYDRDAFGYRGPFSVVAHPPCGAWGRFRRHIERASGRKADEERRCGLFAVECVRKFGGVLEQPACSSLWTAACLPVRGFDSWGGYTLQICQSWFGHAAEKCTWLYIVNGGWPLPVFDFDFSVPARGLLELGRRQREASPVLFAEWLVAIAAGNHSRARPFELAATRSMGHSAAASFDLAVPTPPAVHSTRRPCGPAAIAAAGHSNV